MTFKPGQSGNPSGRPKVVKDIQNLARSHCPDAINTLVSIMRDKRAAAAARATAANSLLDRGYGKAVQAIEATINRVDPETISDAELAVYLARNGGSHPSETSRDTSQLN